MSHLDDEMDNTADFERHETEKKLPIGWVLLFVALIAWGVYYLYAYTPVFSGWTQYSAFEQTIQK